MREIWKKIDETDGLYEVSNLGQVRGRRGPIKPWVNWNGYALVSVSVGGIKKHFTVHKLVLSAFVGEKPTPEYECAHLDNNRLNNRADNLSWVTRKENHSHKKIHGTQQHGERNGNSKFTKKDILKMRKMYLSGYTQVQIAEEFGVRQSYISAIIKGRVWKHI